jgi:PAS domain S-box-containing protein
VHNVRERLERILASIQDAVVSLDSRLRYVFVNSNAAVLLGAKKEDMIGHNVWRFMVDTEDRLVRRNLERAVKERIDLVFEYYYAARDRWYVFVLINKNYNNSINTNFFIRRYESRIYPGSDGGATIYTIDITARKKSEQRLSLLAQVGRLMAVSVDTHLPTLLAEAQNIVAGTPESLRFRSAFGLFPPSFYCVGF